MKRRVKTQPSRKKSQQGTQDPFSGDASLRGGCASSSARAHGKSACGIDSVLPRRSIAQAGTFPSRHGTRATQGKRDYYSYIYIYIYRFIYRFMQEYSIYDYSYIYIYIYIHKYTSISKYRYR